MVQHHKYSITEIENMIPFELDFYTTLLIDFLREENEKNKQNV
jgi:hypothetical protein